MLAQASPATPAATGLTLPADAVARVMTYVSAARYVTPAAWPHDVRVCTGTPGYAWAVQVAAWPPSATPRLALVACTLAQQLTQEIETGAGRHAYCDRALQLRRIRDVQRIRDVRQTAAGGGCEWLCGYCDFLRDWWGAVGAGEVGPVCLLPPGLRLRARTKPFNLVA